MLEHRREYPTARGLRSLGAAGTSAVTWPNGSIDEAGCLVCPWHGAKYDVGTGRMVLGPHGVFAKIPGFGSIQKALTLVFPLGRGRVVERDDTLYVE